MKKTTVVYFIAVLFVLGLGGCNTDLSEENPGFCACSYNEISEKCVLERNKCKNGFKPQCYDLGKEDCDCECVQKR